MSMLCACKTYIETATRTSTVALCKGIIAAKLFANADVIYNILVVIKICECETEQ